MKEAISVLRLTGKPVCIHASMRSFTHRVSGLLESFCEAGCTVLVPTFSDMYEAPPMPEMMPIQNGAGDYSYFMEKEYEDMGVYSPKSNLLTVEEMGVFPQLVLAYPNRLRGANYLNSFTAVGPLARALVEKQTNQDVYAPLEKLYELDSFVLMMGGRIGQCYCYPLRRAKGRKIPIYSLVKRRERKYCSGSYGWLFRWF